MPVRGPCRSPPPDRAHSQRDAAITAGASLQRLFNPRSIALVGASPNPKAISANLQANLEGGGYDGTIHLVTPRHDSIGGRPTYPSLAAIQETVDLALLVVPAAALPEWIEDAVAAGISSVIAYSGGLAETGKAGAVIQRRITELASQNGMRLVGPNCIGVINAWARLNTTFGGVLRNEPWLPGPVAIVGQSGSVASAIMQMLNRRGVGVGYLVSSGNEAVLDTADYLQHFCTDDHVKVVIAYQEQLRRGPQIRRAASALEAAGKSLVMLTGGLTTPGARAAAAHTAAIPHESFKAQAGVTQVDTVEEAVAAVTLLTASKPMPRGRRVMIVAASGGIGVLAADLAEKAGMKIPPLASAGRRSLEELLPAFASARNPIDITPSVARDPDTMTAVLQAAASCPGIDVIALCSAMHEPAAERLAAAAATTFASMNRFAIAAWINGSNGVARQFANRGVPYFDDIRTAFKTLANISAPRSAGGGQAALISSPRSAGGGQVGGTLR